jgi:hypothetical protein
VNAHISVSVADSPEFKQLAADAQRYRFFRRYLLRRAPSPTATGGVVYGIELETPAPIDRDAFDRILDQCRAEDNGSQANFDRAETADERLVREAALAAPVTRPARAVETKPRTYQPKPCAKCGAPFNPSGPRALFCGACR